MKVYLFIALAVVALLGAAAFIQSQRSSAAEAERQRQVKANAEFQIKHDEGASSFDDCELAGGLYDFRKGTCKLR